MNSNMEIEVSKVDPDKIEVRAKSVVGGWQSCFEKTGYLFGPTFNKITDLWAWQRINIFGKGE